MTNDLLRQRSALPHTIEIVNPLHEPRWDDMVQELTSSTVFHGSAWARVLSETYKYRPAYFAMRTADRLSGLLACMEIHGWRSSPRAAALPFTDESEPLVTDSTDGAKLSTAVLNH